MITEKDFIHIDIEDPYEAATVKYVGRKMELGGRSHIRTNHAERMSNIRQDQVTGQACQMAMCKWWFGSINEYLIHGLTQNLRRCGDRGVDIPNRNVDVKGSLRRVDPKRGSERRYIDYRLIIPADEYHEDWIYVQAILADTTETRYHVILTGWAHTSMLPPQPTPNNEMERFPNCYVTNVRDLMPLNLRTMEPYLRHIEDIPFDFHDRVCYDK